MEAEHDKIVQCKNDKCLYNKKMYVPDTDTLQFCCGRKSKITRLDENGKCVWQPEK